MNETHKTPEYLWSLIKGIKYGMFTTHHGNGHLHSRPMTTQNQAIEADGRLWFFMSRKSDPVEDLKAKPSVAVIYADPGSDTYVSVSGDASEVDDMAQKKALWNKATEAWFPDGPTDPDVALIAVDIIHANYWDVKESKVVQLAAMAKAVVTGKPPNIGEQGEVRMR